METCLKLDFELEHVTIAQSLNIRQRWQWWRWWWLYFI